MACGHSLFPSCPLGATRSNLALWPTQEICGEYCKEFRHVSTKKIAFHDLRRTCPGYATLPAENLNRFSSSWDTHRLKQLSTLGCKHRLNQGTTISDWRTIDRQLWATVAPSLRRESIDSVRELKRRLPGFPDRVHSFRCLPGSCC